jgi:hypothetical protein
MTATSLAVALSNTLLGTVYTCYGLMTIVDMKRGWREHGFSHFGAAWIAMAFTCGPHHLDHGLHGLITGREGGGLELVTILIGLTPGVIWFLLRVEAMFGGRGDRFISGTPLWLESLPTALATYTAAVIAASLWIVGPSEVFAPRIIPNLCLVVLYSSIGYVLLRTQLRNYPLVDGWSVSGVSLAAVMYTCALMHAVFALYANGGRYYLDWHQAAIDIVAVPAAAYFLWVTYALYQGSLRDWNSAPEPTIRLGAEGPSPVAS